MKMVFSERMNQPNQKRQLVKLLMEKTQTSESTVYRWISGVIVPPPIKQQIIADVLGEPVEQLFPKKK